MRRSDPAPTVFLEFGPTAVGENGRAPEPLVDPDFATVFVTRQVAGGEMIDRIVQSGVGLDEVLAGLSGDDVRLRDPVLPAIGRI